MSVNKVILLGRAGKDAELRSIANGSQTASFSLATSEKYKDKTGKLVENTDWHNIVAWGKTAEIAGKYIKKGDQVYLEGRLRHRSYEKDDVTRYVTEVVVDTITLLGNKRQGDGSTASPGAGEPAYQESQPVTAGGGTDDLPF